jgi:hypothetical protein
MFKWLMLMFSRREPTPAQKMLFWTLRDFQPRGR